MRIENSTGVESSDFNCFLWYLKQPDPNDFPSSPLPCPCTFEQATIDNRYISVEATFPYTQCFYTLRSVGMRGRRCCYYKDAKRLGALIVGYPYGGTIDQYHMVENKDRHEESDLPGFRYCCLNARYKKIACPKYYKKRPSEGCEDYTPPRQGTKFRQISILVSDAVSCNSSIHPPI